MAPPNPKIQDKKPQQANLFAVLKPYKGLIVLLVLLAVGSNGISLVLPKLISSGIDSYGAGHFQLSTVIWQFSILTVAIFVLTYLQSLVQTYASEKVARNLRTELSAKISKQSFTTLQKITPGKLLTNLTADIDSVKMFVSQAIVSLVSSLFLILGASVLLLMINWKLALVVLTMVPIIGGTFFVVFAKVKTLFKRSREILDVLNKVINESILGAGLIRILNAQQREYEKFFAANTDAKNLGLSILSLFASMIPVIVFVANLAVLAVLALGGHFVINGTMTLGNFAAFNSYISILIFPILIIGFMSNIIAQASASYQRVFDVLAEKEKEETGKETKTLKGDIAFENVTLEYGQKPVLKDVSFQIKGGTKTAIIGPTAAGKTQLLYLLTGLIQPTKGSVEFDGIEINEYGKSSLYPQLGFVFQDSIVFNLSLRENIAFSDTVKDESLHKAIDTAELEDFIHTLPEGLNTIVSERGSSLSGGQKQRIMLARALALDPKILLLDDFTARVDTNTEQKILKNVEKNYPNITLVSITQKLSSVEHYDQIILLMEGEVLATGTHAELMHSSPEYVQIFDSQQSTNTIES